MNLNQLKIKKSVLKNILNYMGLIWIWWVEYEFELIKKSALKNMY